MFTFQHVQSGGSELQTSGGKKKFLSKPLPRSMRDTTDVGSQPYSSLLLLYSLFSLLFPLILHSCLKFENEITLYICYLPCSYLLFSKSSYSLIPQFLTNMLSLCTDIIQKGKGGWSRHRGVFAGKSTALVWRGGVFSQYSHFDRDRGL